LVYKRSEPGHMVAVFVGDIISSRNTPQNSNQTCQEIHTTMSSGQSSPTSPSNANNPRDVESNLNHTKDLLQSYSRITSSGSSSLDVEETRAELRATLEALEADLEDLDESVRAVEGAGSRWGMGDQEIGRRRGFVERVKKEVKVRSTKAYILVS